MKKKLSDHLEINGGWSKLANKEKVTAAAIITHTLDRIKTADHHR